MENKLFPVRAFVDNVFYSDTIDDTLICYKWERRGDVFGMTIDQIKRMFKYHPAYRDWLLPDDNEALIALGMTRADYDRIKAAADKANARRAVM